MAGRIQQRSEERSKSESREKWRGVEDRRVGDRAMQERKKEKKARRRKRKRFAS